MQPIDVVVLGAGAAGLFCAAVAAAKGKTVTVLEHNLVPGRKIRISGGGRCNFTNLNTSHHNFISQNPDFARSALTRYTPQDFISLVERYKIKWHEKTLGQLFCDGSSQQITDMLMHECEINNVSIRTSVRVVGIEKEDCFEIHTDKGHVFARNVVVATGGLSVPSLGTTDVGYLIAKHFDIPVIEPQPALVPLTFNNVHAQHFASLSGVSMPVRTSVGNISFRESMLFTHRGVSGPAILQISSYMGVGSPLTIDLIPDVDEHDVFADTATDQRELATLLSTMLPKRFVQGWVEHNLHRRISQTSKKELLAIAHAMKHWSLTPTGNEGFAKAEVTKGGVSTSALSSKTMESKSIEGMFFIGEVVDVTGWLGGYNFQWAWSSAQAAGVALQDR
ncbi:MAG: NAD(P)/FAD-dependent oxidoreductase [Ignavibacteria bacterium]|nr:NAD(P)/FAD-dependent oxidoreductase [Ignavibacteria bacterium]